MVTFKEVYIDDMYSMEDFDLMWQMINLEQTRDVWTSIVNEKARDK